MLEEKGIVLSVSGQTAEVAPESKAACGSCSAKAGCGTSLLADLFPQRKRALMASNPVHAQVGDRVVIGLDENALQLASLLIYLVPLLGLIGGAILGAWLSPEFAESGSIVLGMAGFMGVLILVRKYSRHLSGNNRFQARILRVEAIKPIEINDIKLEGNPIDG